MTIRGITIEGVFVDAPTPDATIERLKALTPEQWDAFKAELTGHDAARALTALRIPAMYVVHSINPTGATRIVQTLASAGLKVQRVPVFDLMAQHKRNVVVPGSEA